MKTASPIVFAFCFQILHVIASAQFNNYVAGKELFKIIKVNLLRPISKLVYIFTYENSFQGVVPYDLVEVWKMSNWFSLSNNCFLKMNKIS